MAGQVACMTGGQVDMLLLTQHIPGIVVTFMDDSLYRFRMMGLGD